MMHEAKSFQRCAACGFFYRSPKEDPDDCPCGAGKMTIITTSEYRKLMRKKWTRKKKSAIGVKSHSLR